MAHIRIRHELHERGIAEDLIADITSISLIMHGLLMCAKCGKNGLKTNCHMILKLAQNKCAFCNIEGLHKNKLKVFTVTNES